MKSATHIHDVSTLHAAEYLLDNNNRVLKISCQDRQGDCQSFTLYMDANDYTSNLARKIVDVVNAALPRSAST